MSRIGLEKIEVSDDYDWDLTTGTLTELDMAKIAKEGLQIADPEEFTSEDANLHHLLNGMRWNGVLRVEPDITGLPADNTLFHLVVTPMTGAARAYGGSKGCKGRLVEPGIPSLDSGRLYQSFNFSFKAVSSAAGIKDVA